MVSVIIPVYNVENYLKECIDSVLHQTYKDIEIILVDDGSTDNSGNICDRYAEENRTIKVIHKKNQGLGMARNSGIEIASGDYIYFQDSDDYIGCNHIMDLLHCIEIDETDACLVGFIAVSNDKKILNVRSYEDEHYIGASVRESLLPRLIGSSSKQKDSIEMSASGNLYSKKTIDKYGLRFCSERKLISEDLIFNMDFFGVCKGISLTSKGESYYRYNQESLSHRYLANRFDKATEFYKVIKCRLNQLGYGEEVLNRARRMYFINIKMCIAQELDKNIVPYNEALIHILEICSSQDVMDAISEYPISELGLKQRVFLKLIMHKNIRMIYLLMKYFA